LVSSDELKQLSAIERLIKKKLSRETLVGFEAVKESSTPIQNNRRRTYRKNY